MNALRPILLALATLLVTHSAQAQKRTTIGFETQCDGSGTPGIFVGGYKQVSGTLFAPCGAASITSGGLTGQQQLAQNGIIPLIGNIPGITGNVALAGAFNASTFGDVVIVFSPPVNEVSFDVLSLDNASGLQIALAGAQGAALPPVDNPRASGGIVHYARTSTTPIERITLSYTPVVISLGDGWFIDQLAFNAWICGDGETETGEACDDGNRVQCDGCSNSCQASTTGCFNGTTCVASGATLGCVVCDAATPAGPSGDKPTTPGPVGTPCDDNLFCTLPGSCDAAGTCQQSPNTCSDGIVCTVDSCDETNDQCLHPIEDKWCLIAGSCVPSGTGNPTNVCQLCTASASQTAWSIQPAGTQCGDPKCSAGSESAASSCDASGACQAGAAKACEFMTCANTVSCDGHCTTDQQCPQQAHCDNIGTVCVADQPPASACTRDAQCASNSCVDSVCCDKSCKDACESCNQQGKVGICTLLAAMSIDPEGRCGDKQFCSAQGSCTSPTPPVTTPPVTTPPVTTPPVGVRPMGTGCDSNEVCGSGVCQDGVCCDRACDGLCESCAVSGQPAGQCLPIALGADPDNECGGGGAVCDGHNACTSYETRGNGLCSAAPPKSRDDTGPLGGFAALLTLGSALAWRRRKSRVGAA